jgi:hypothetical protein
MKNTTELKQQDSPESSSSKRPGFKVDNFLIIFPEAEEFVTEDENGLAINVDIYRLEGDNRVKIKQGELTEDLEIKISAYINEMLMQAIEEEKNNVKD